MKYVQYAGKIYVYVLKNMLLDMYIERCREFYRNMLIVDQKMFPCVVFFTKE